MGISSSKAETCEALRLCKERKKFIKQAIDSRYSLAAAHIVYINSLQTIGSCLVKLAEIESYSPTPKPNVTTVNYMKPSGSSVVTVNVRASKTSNCNKVYVGDVENLSFTMSPPQPPPPPPRFSWDYFDPSDGSFRFMNHERFQVKSDDMNNVHEEINTPDECDENNLVENEAKGESENDEKEECDLKEEETQDPSEMVIHGGKDFVSSIKDIEEQFVRASKAGNEVSRMLEANKIQVNYSEANKGSSNSTSTGSNSAILTCFRGETALVLHEPSQTTKVITWKRSTSSHSSSLHPSRTMSHDDNENHFMEEFCMISGSHSSTLDRLYAWERKLYDEVKTSESIRKEYDRKCDQLRHQFAKDLKPHVIDKTRSMAKDLHSRIRVALHTVDSISKRIEKMRDEELQPQLMELIEGLIRMWKSMLECQHVQYTTISSSHHSTISRTTTDHENETKNQIMIELQHEIECFALSFTDLIKCYTSYIDSINNWLHNCITQPKERAKARRVFSPRRAVAPPIFVICRDWLAGFQALPAQKLGDAIKDLLSHVRRVSMEEIENKEMGVENGEVMGSDLSKIHSGLTKVLDRLTKFSEESLKMYEDIKENSETAGNVYLNYRPPMRAFSV